MDVLSLTATAITNRAAAATVFLNTLDSECRGCRGARRTMSLAELQTNRIDRPQEDARLSALAATEILDTEPEPSFDAITRLSAAYFRADTVLLSFADASRVWIKSYWGEAVRELPRNRSVFEMVLAVNGSVTRSVTAAQRRAGARLRGGLRLA